MGAHFHKHAVERGLNPASQLDKIMEFCQLTIVASVEPGLPDSQARLNRLEADIQNRLMTMERHGGMNLREEVRRGRKYIRKRVKGNERKREKEEAKKG